MTEEQKFCKLLLKECIILRDKKGKKLDDTDGICHQLYRQSEGTLYICYVTRSATFFANRIGIFYVDYLPYKGVWTPTRRKVLLAMIDGLQDRKVRKELIERLEFYGAH